MVSSDFYPDMSKHYAYVHMYWFFSLNLSVPYYDRLDFWHIHTNSCPPPSPYSVFTLLWFWKNKEKTKQSMAEPCSAATYFLSSSEIITDIFYVCLVFHVSITIHSQIVPHKFKLPFNIFRQIRQSFFFIHLTLIHFTHTTFCSPTLICTESL